MSEDCLPDCMMPDGGQCCAGYTKQRQRIEALEAALREIDNMAPATCEVTLAHQMADIARAALAEEQEK